MTPIARPLVALALVVVGLIVGGSPAAAQAPADSQVVFAVHVTLAPRWLDPGETEAAITPFMVLYAIHDALVKPMPAGPTTPSLAESWSASPDGTTYEFVLRAAKFHNGDPVTAEDVKSRSSATRAAPPSSSRTRSRRSASSTPAGCASC